MDGVVWIENMANKQAMMELLSDVKIISHSLNLFLLRSGGGGGG